LNALIDDTVVLYAVDSSPAFEKRYRARFYFNPNSLVMGNNTSHFIFDGYNTNKNDVMFRLELFYEGGTYKLRPRILRDDSGYTNGSKYVIGNDWHVIEIDWNTSTAPGANNGYLSLWIDGTLAGTIANVDNDQAFQRVDEARLGATGGLDAATSGSMLFDNFESRRETYLGPLTPPATQEASPTPTETPTLEPTPIETLTPSPTPMANLPEGIYSNVSLSLPKFLQIRSDYYVPQPQATLTAITIDYTYDPLNRLTAADYSTGDYYHYAYDSVGNRLSQEDMVGGQPSVFNYVYDDANRLASVNGVNYTFDDNGNLLSDGTNTYVYDYANRLVSVSGQSTGEHSNSVESSSQR
jgi:hypothetical protein